MLDDLSADPDLRGSFQHYTVVGGEVGFALSTIENNSVDRFIHWRREFYLCRESRATHTGNTSISDAFQQHIPVNITPVFDGLHVGGSIALRALNHNCLATPA